MGSQEPARSWPKKGRGSAPAPLDVLLRDHDTPGDEGGLFRLLVFGAPVSADDEAALRAEDDRGTIVYDGPAVKDHPLQIDTTQLADGEHKLLLAACNPNVAGGFTQCGVLVIRFVVDNVDITLQPGESLTIECATGITATTTPTRAEVTCG